MSREIKFRVWDIEGECWYPIDPTVECLDILSLNEFLAEQFTGLLDKNGFAEVYEGDIIGLDGIKKGDVHENPDLLKDKTNLVIEGLGTKAWRSAEQKAMERGCYYAE